jgi:hypothetical protein
LRNDYSAAVVTHLDPDGNVIVDAVRHWVGTRTAPVNLMQVEDALVALARRFRPRDIVLDQWQAALLGDRLRARNVRGSVKTVTFDGNRLDAHATLLKSLFVNRMIRVPHHAVLVEQLETIVGEELKRRDRVRFREASGQHDDLVVALCLSAEALGREVGRLTLPPNFSECWRAQSVANFSPMACYLFGGPYFPSGCPSCTACRGHQAVKVALYKHVQRTGEDMAPRQFYAERMRGNGFTGRVRFEEWANSAGF